ncbi:MAG: hypothetical protein LBC97_08135 [Bifidobacteriaceae bacterium]|jgi:hypothetical protein|nr:hypothetical protein [Bifidobacteriaceae bacterium]
MSGGAMGGGVGGSAGRGDGVAAGRARGGRAAGRAGGATGDRAAVARFLRFTAAAIAVLLAAWLGFIWWAGQSGARAYSSGDHAKAEDRYSLAGSFMMAERWKAWFGDGTAVLAGGNAARAEDLLKEALAGVPAAKECVVRINLSLAQERQGDQAAAADPLTAQELYTEALETLRAGGCPAEDQTAAEAEQRLELKRKDPGEEPEDDPSDGGDEEDDQSGEGDESDDGEDGEGGETGGTGGQSGQGSASAETGQTSDPTGSGDGGDPTGGQESEDDDLNDRLEELRERNRQGQMDRQDGQVEPDWSGRYWDRPIW